MLTFKSFAEFKRSLVVGMRFKVDNYLHPNVSGEREVSRVQGNALAYWRTKPDGTREEGWCPYPKASGVRVDGGRVTFLAGEGADAPPAFTYYDFEPVERQ